MTGFSLYLIITYLVVTPLAGWLWSRKYFTLWLWAVPAIVVYPLLWNTPGGGAVIVGMGTLLIFLRALDANACFNEVNGARYALYCHWLLTHRSEHRDRETHSRILFRFIRGSIFLLITLVLMKSGKHFELWRDYPYLDDWLMAAEVTLGLVGAMDIVTVISMLLGVKVFIVDGVAADFFLAPSLRAFWNHYWNRPTAGVLNRGIFIPSGGRRNRVRSVMLVFFACGLMHAIPLILAGEQRMLWLLLAISSLAFFMIQALALCVEYWLPHFLRNGLFARAYFYIVMAISIPLYPAPIMIAFGIHQRPPETATMFWIIEFFS